MSRKVIMLSLILTMGIAIGMIGSQRINAQQPPGKSRVLQRTDMAGIEGKEGVIILTEIFPRAVTPKHYHPGNELSYVLEGSMILEVEGGRQSLIQRGSRTSCRPSKCTTRRTSA